MTNNNDNLIDFDMLEKLAEQGASGMVRPIDAPANNLGFSGIDPMDVDHGMHIALQAGQALEQMRGPEGFNPNTVAFVWPDNQLSINGLITVARNFTTWNL